MRGFVSESVKKTDRIDETNLTFYSGNVRFNISYDYINFTYGSDCVEDSFLFRPDPEEKVYLQTTGELYVEGLGTFNISQYCIDEVDGEISALVCGSVEVSEEVVNFVEGYWLENGALCVKRENANSTPLKLSEEYENSKAIRWCENPTELTDEDLHSSEGFCIEENYEPFTGSLRMVKCAITSKIIHSVKVPVRKCCEKSEIMLNSSCKYRDSVDLDPLVKSISLRSSQRLVTSMLKCRKDRHRIRVDNFKLEEDGRSRQSGQLKIQTLTLLEHDELLRPDFLIPRQIKMKLTGDTQPLGLIVRNFIRNSIAGE
ncbi:unnamed protein product [Acanthoscelides obtectus]|uniref:Uncharacterized protein n=1 Tax=Acanthoscelides obtectus TaxID=200917 RepID=A0A9P0QA15_ACAOB|nr:unnamed protein product [Acanthoscelides obtectus]CAK1675469.1 hypothetical protein AOBTE_LOCUS30238 [Acanthoscelides obtectus]